MMNKKAVSAIIKNIIIIIILLVIASYFYRCQIQTYKFKHETDKIKLQLDYMGCNVDKIEDPDLIADCNVVIKEHNNIVKQWAEMPCVEIDIEQLLEKGKSPDQAGEFVLQ